MKKQAVLLSGPVRYRVGRAVGDDGAGAPAAVCRVFVDGACSGNHHRRVSDRLGGYGIYFESTGHSLSGTLRDHVVCDVSDSDAAVTNNRLEMMAVIALLERIVDLRRQQTRESGIEQASSLPDELRRGDVELRIIGDNQYVLNAAVDWLPGWRSKGYRKQKGDEVKNIDLVRRLDRLLLTFEKEQWPLSFQWVRAHQAEPSTADFERWQMWYGNQQADSLATKAAKV